MSSVLSELEDAAQQITLARYFVVATLALYVYDYLITLDAEIQYMWTARRSIMKLAFFANRYMPFIGAGGLAFVFTLSKPSTEYCTDTFIIFGSFMQANFIISEFILYYRAYAVWGCTRTTLLVLGMVFLPVVAVSSWVAAVVLNSTEGLEISFTSRGCLLVPERQIVWAILVVYMLSETCKDHFYSNFALAVILLRAYHIPGSLIMTVIYRDGVIFYFFILLTFIINLILSRAAPEALRTLLVDTQAVLHSIFCNRMLMHIRASYEKFSSKPSINSYKDGAVVGDWRRYTFETPGPDLNLSIPYETELRMMRPR